MDEQFKVCGNCGHCTMMGGQFVCIKPGREQEVVPLGARRDCFVITPLSEEQFKAAILAAGTESVAIN